MGITTCNNPSDRLVYNGKEITNLLKNMTYELKSNGIVVNTFETAQDAMDYGEAYYKEGYTVTSK